MAALALLAIAATRVFSCYISTSKEAYLWAMSKRAVHKLRLPCSVSTLSWQTRSLMDWVWVLNRLGKLVQVAIMLSSFFRSKPLAFPSSGPKAKWWSFLLRPALAMFLSCCWLRSLDWEFLWCDLFLWEKITKNDNSGVSWNRGEMNCNTMKRVLGI